MRRSAFIISLSIITPVAVAAVWFWALTPGITNYVSLGNSADDIRHFWHFRLIQPEWVGKPPDYDYGRWAQAETFTRLAVVFLSWVASSVFVYLKSRKMAPRNSAL